MMDCMFFMAGHLQTNDARVRPLQRRALAFLLRLTRTTPSRVRACPPPHHECRAC